MALTTKQEIDRQADKQTSKQANNERTSTYRKKHNKRPTSPVKSATWFWSLPYNNKKRYRPLWWRIIIFSYIACTIATLSVCVCPALCFVVLGGAKTWHGVGGPEVHWQLFEATPQTLSSGQLSTATFYISDKLNFGILKDGSLWFLV